MSALYSLPPIVAIVGLGNMGAPMARRLLAAARTGGTRLLVHARRAESAAGLVRDGAEWAATPRDLGRADLILSMLPDVPPLVALLDGPDGLLAAAPTERLLLVGSTSSPDGVRRLHERTTAATGGSLRVLDVPVSGGVEGAEAGTLAIMVGGDPRDAERADGMLRILGRPTLLGPLGSGQVAKACNQAVVAATIIALGEAAVLAERSGLDVRALFDVLGGGYAAGRILETRGSRIADEDYSPAGPARFMVKDLGFALDEAARTGTVLPQITADHALFRALTEQGMGDLDIAVTRRYVAGLRAR